MPRCGGSSADIDQEGKMKDEDPRVHETAHQKAQERVLAHDRVTGTYRPKDLPPGHLGRVRPNDGVPQEPSHSFHSVLENLTELRRLAAELHDESRTLRIRMVGGSDPEGPDVSELGNRDHASLAAHLNGGIEEAHTHVWHARAQLQAIQESLP
jgi:hypothetical protein